MVGMHTEKGRKMVEEMIGTEWRVYGLDKAVLEPEQEGSVTFLLNHIKGTKIPAIKAFKGRLQGLIRIYENNILRGHKPLLCTLFPCYLKGVLFPVNPIKIYRWERSL
jgi:hypothetical protein